MQNALTVPDGEKIRELRAAAGMTQEKLAAMSNVHTRTVQRAEKGTPMQAESLADIASALKVQVPQIVRAAELEEEEVDDLEAKSLIVLRPIVSGMALINTIRGSFDGAITCEAEPTQQNIDPLTELITALEQWMPQPWRSPSDEPEFPLSARLRVAVTLTEQLKVLATHEISVFISTYTAKAQIPRYDYEERQMYITARTPFDLVTICRIVIAPAARGERMTLKVNDLYVKPKAPIFEAPEDLQAHADQRDDEIPF
jgi:transcriptional regulator with XRE-family HTH domain